MRSKILSGSLFVVTTLFLAGAFVAAASAQDVPPPATCSNATLAGNYGVVISGFAGSNILASGGQLTANGKGNFHGTWTININGSTTTHVPITGTYSLASNCTGQATLTPSGGGTATLNIIVDSAATRIEMIVTLSGETQAGYALAQGAATCSLAGIKGTWGMLETPGFVTGVGAGAFIGQVVLDGAGKLLARAVTESVNGDIAPNLSGPGTYTMGSNCVGTLSVPHPDGTVFQTQLVIVNGGKEMVGVGLEPNTIGYQTLTRQ